MLENEINDALKKAIKDRDTNVVSVLRMMLSEIKNYRIANLIKSGPTPDEGVIGVLQKMAKRYKESIDSFEKGGRADLVEKESRELDILKKFLPEALTDIEVEKIVCEAISQAGASSMKDMPAVMRVVMPLVKGRADGRLVNEIVRKKLGGC